MNCDKILKLIIDKFAGGISASDENQLAQHLESCAKCQEFHTREQQISDDLKSLDSNKYREESIEAFGRLAVAVRSYRSPKSRWLEGFQVKPMRAAWVTTMLLVFVIGLSSLNFSYSHTSGANLRIDFDPPVEKSQHINLNDFSAKFNGTLLKILSKPNNDRKISWSIQMESDSLSSLSFDIETNKAIDIADTYNALLGYYPSFAQGEVSISPLKEELRKSAFNMIISREPDTLADDEIRKIVSEVLPASMAKIESRLQMIERESDRVHRIIEDELPQIRELVKKLNGLNFNNVTMDLTVARMQDGGAQLDDLSNVPNPFAELRNGIEEILIDGGLNPDELNIHNLIQLDCDKGTTRIIIGGSDNLFEPYSIGGRKISIIHGSGDKINLNGANDVIKSTEIDDLLNGTISPETLKSIVGSRLRENNKETIVIEVYKGSKRAEITIKNNDVDIVLTSPPISNIRLNVPRGREYEDNEDYKELLEWDKDIKSEREIVLKHSDSTSEDTNSHPFNAPVYMQQDDLLQDYMTESEIAMLISGQMKISEMENRIRERIKEENNPVGNRNLALIRDGKIIKIKINGDNVVISIDNQSSTNLSSGSVVVTHPDESQTISPNNFDLIRDGLITEQEISDIIHGRMPTWLAEKKLSSRLDEKFGENWSNDYAVVMKRTENEKSLEIRIEEGEVKITLE